MDTKKVFLKNHPLRLDGAFKTTDKKKKRVGISSDELGTGNCELGIGAGEGVLFLDLLG